MQEIEWIKISTNIFNDEKIKVIEAMPEADTLLVIWIKLLTLAGKTNDAGYIYLTKGVPYTPDTLAAVLERPKTVVSLALEVFSKFGMIKFVENSNVTECYVEVTNWEKWQNVEGMQRVRELAAARQRKFRANQAQNQTQKSLPVTLPVTLHNAIELDIKNKIILYIDEILEHLNKKTGSNYRKSTKKTQTLIKARYAEGFNFEDFIKVIDIKCASWIGTEFEKFLRPETLFGTKFESYLNEKPIINTGSDKAIKGKAYHCYKSFNGVSCRDNYEKGNIVCETCRSERQNWQALK